LGKNSKKKKDWQTNTNGNYNKGNSVLRKNQQEMKEESDYCSTEYDYELCCSETGQPTKHVLTRKAIKCAVK
jgi:hypothetical protein